MDGAAAAANPGEGNNSGRTGTPSTKSSTPRDSTVKEDANSAPPAPRESKELTEAALPENPARDRIVIRASKKWKDFGSKCSFSDRDAVETFSSGTMECRPFKDQSYDKSLAEREIAIQSVPFLVDSGAQTNQEIPRNNVIQYQPQDIEPEVAKEVLASENLCSFLGSVKSSYIYALQQNEVMDLFEDDFANLAEEEENPGHKSITNIMEYQSFSDLLYSKGKMISCVDWMPGKHGILAAACSESKSFDERLQVSGKPSNSHVLIWSFSDPINPQIILESPSDIFSLRFNPTKPELVAAGCYTGQVILWDISVAKDQVGKNDKVQLKGAPTTNKKEEDKENKRRAPVVVFTLLSSVAKSHTAVVSDLHWLPPDMQLEGRSIVRRYADQTSLLVSVGADGKIIFWDITFKKVFDVETEGLDEARTAALAAQKYQWSPVLEINLMLETPEQSGGLLKMILCKESRFFCCNEIGDILEGDINVPEGSKVVQNICACHHGPVRSLHRSPFFEDIILSVDVWTFALWRVGFEKPIFVSRSVEGYLTTGCWSPSRPGVIYIGSIDGSIEVWDLLDHSHQPSLKASIGSCQVTSMEFCSSSPQLLAAGDIQGVLHIMEIPRRLRRIQHKEKVVMQKFFERQESWVNNVNGRATERAKQAEKRQTDEFNRKEREKVLAKCCWDDEMESKYQQYEAECRSKFGSASAAALTGSM